MGKNMLGKSVSLPTGIALGTTLSMALTLGGAAILASLIGNESIPISTMGTGSTVLHLSSAALGAIMSAALTKKKRLMVCGITVAAYFAMLLAMTAILFDGQYERVGVTALMILLGGVLATLPAFLRKGSGGKMGKLRPIR